MPEQGAVADKTTVAESVDSVKEPVDHAPPPAEPEQVPSSEGIVQQGLPSFAQPTMLPAPTAPAAPEEPAVVEDKSVPTEPAKPLEPVEPVEPAEPAGLLEPAKTEAEPSVDANEKSNAWLETLREAANKRREESTASRKRAHDEPEEEPQPSDGPKAAKISKPEAPPPRKSMALSSIKPLPTLPILEQINSTLARKPTEQQKPEPPKPKPSQIDEDELLLSAARIAAESLRSGPRLTESWPSYYSEPPGSTFGPASSFSSSMPPLSGSQSPHQSPRVNGHDLALAPDDLGLGRTLSRTEQRLRLTGGKGLAYKPLDFTPEKKKRKSFGR